MHCILWRHVDRLHHRYKPVNYPFKVFLTLALLFKVMPLNAADISANASRDAMRLVESMKAFDAVCANSLTYTKIFEDHGMSRDELDKTVANFYQKLKSDHATYSRFDLRAPWRPFVMWTQLYFHSIRHGAGGSGTEHLVKGVLYRRIR